jgi:transcriptional regulator with XRE-family HTH domain
MAAASKLLLGTAGVGAGQHPIVRDRAVPDKPDSREWAAREARGPTFVGSVERGERNVSVLNLRLIARALRVPLAELLDGLA